MMRRRTTSHATRLAVAAAITIWAGTLIAQSVPQDSVAHREGPPFRGFCIAAPRPNQLEDFVRFIEEELASNNINILVLRIDYNFEYQSHPELRDSVALSLSDVKRIVATCQKGGIRVIPQFNLLGHQSWHGKINNLLRVYPHLDETPHIELPKVYEWPNADGLYCKSYCPRHPEVHPIVLALVDELVAAFEANAFHAGMDEVFYIGDDECSRCAGRDKAELFADEVTLLRNHLARDGRELWIWGDRLIDGKTTGIGMWEASMNSTHRAVDLIPKDVVICDWHYEQAVPTAPYFAAKGFRVVSCPWNRAEVALAQIHAIEEHRRNSPPLMRGRFLGVMQTVWSDLGKFLDEYHGRSEADPEDAGSVECAKTFLAEMKATTAQ